MTRRIQCMKCKSVVEIANDRGAPSRPCDWCGGNEWMALNERDCEADGHVPIPHQRSFALLHNGAKLGFKQSHGTNISCAYCGVHIAGVEYRAEAGWKSIGDLIGKAIEESDD